MYSSRGAERWLHGWRAWITGLVVWTVIGLLAFAYRYLDVFVRARTEPFYEKLIEEMTGAYGTGLLFPLLATYVGWLRARRMRWYAVIAAHLAVLPLYSAVHTSWLWLSRTVAYDVLRLGNYDYGIMSWRYAMEFPNHVIEYSVLAFVVFLFQHYRDARDRDLRVAHLEGELTKARLGALEAQLHPHFLFNTLNTISSVMYRDRSAADRMLAGLGDLLRKALKTSSHHEIPLREELDTLRLYLDIMRVRFADRLEIVVDVSDDVVDIMVPQFILQPLVENALRHGDPGLEQVARLSIGAREDAGRIMMWVEDNGPGLRPPAANGDGVGLTNTRRRLEHLYGSRQHLDLSTGNGGGLRVEVTFPAVRSASS